MAEKYDVNLVYGKRRLVDRATGRTAESDVLLIDPTHLNPRLEQHFKFNLYRRFGLQSDRYEQISDYLLYLQIAEPAYEALAALLERSKGPFFVLAHEYMGMPLALKTVLVGDPRFRAIFYAHEVATMRALVEDSPGHDTMFYNAMAQALKQGQNVSDVFGDQSGFYRHALIERSRFCHGIFAVGDFVLQELQFLGPGFQDRPIDRVYNGIPAVEISTADKLSSRGLLQRYAEALLGVRPDAIFTHVTRPVVSKGVWRDLRVLEHLDGMFASEGRRGVFFVLSTAVGMRGANDVAGMEADYGWPVEHRPGPPDLVGSEVDLLNAVSAYNHTAQAIQAVFVNQFGWDRASCGSRMPAEMEFLDLRKGTDVEFGQSIYEPFGIAGIEPLSFGALCVVSNVCGCCGFAAQVAGGKGVGNLIVSDYTTLPESRALEEIVRIDAGERGWIEAQQSRKVAQEIWKRLPASEGAFEASIQTGYRAAKEMSWDRVCADLFLPGLERVAGQKV